MDNDRSRKEKSTPGSEVLRACEGFMRYGATGVDAAIKSTKGEAGMSHSLFGLASNR